ARIQRARRSLANADSPLTIRTFWSKQETSYASQSLPPPPPPPLPPPSGTLYVPRNLLCTSCNSRISRPMVSIHTSSHPLQLPTLPGQFSKSNLRISKHLCHSLAPWEHWALRHPNSDTHLTTTI
ncbi:MAG: hypothetical protein LQ341_004298, partial [Variospora aurantia]